MRLLHLFLLFLFVFPLQILASNLTKLEEPILFIPAPYVDGGMPIAVCEGEDITLGELPIINTTGYTEIFWFADANQNTALPSSTNVEEDTTYYAFQAIDPNALFLEVQVEMIPYIPAPTGESDQYFTDGCPMHLSDAVVYNNSGYTQIVWYADCNGCGPIGEPIDPNTVVQDGDVYYATQGDNGCCPGCLEVTFHAVQPIPAPTGDTDQYFTEGTGFTLSDAAINNTSGFDGIYWFTDAQQCADEVDPSIEIEDGDVYYVFQGVCGCMTECQCILHLQVTFHSIPIGIDDDKEDFFKLYPSPVKDILTIRLDKEIRNFTIRITDANGKIVYKKNEQSLQTNLKIDVSKFDPGVYILNLWADGKHQTNKIIVE